MRRRDFLASTAAAAASALPTPYIRSTAAQSRKDTLLTVSETGPNSLDLMMPGANISCYEVGWNTYDRLATFGLTLMVEDLVVLQWGPADLVGRRAPGLKGAVEFFGQNIPSYDLFLIVLGPAVLVGRFHR